MFKFKRFEVFLSPKKGSISPDFAYFINIFDKIIWNVNLFVYICVLI